MSSSESSEAETMRVSVGDVAAMNDAELAHFMLKHRLPSGDYDLPVDGWDKLSRDDRNLFAGRLEAQKRSLGLSHMACSRPLDLDDLDARLRRVSPNESFPLRRQPGAVAQSRSPTPPYDPTELETETYHELVQNGGRPLYPIDLIQDVHRQPDNYAELLRPWQESPIQVKAEDIFQRQLQRWQDFRKWQNDNRDREDDDGGFLAHVERQKRQIQQDYPPHLRAERLANIEADPSCFQRGWDVLQSLRERQRRLYREHGCRGLHDYAKAVKRRLALHDFTRPFQLDEDPKKQDRLTTWIEYLNYEYWWLDKYTSDIERLEPEHDRLWQELVDEKILRPHETKEFVRTMASPMERQSEEDQAEKVVRRAESEAKRIFTLTQEDPKRTSIPKAKRISMLKVGTEKLLAAKQRFEQVRSRNNRIGDFIRATFDYDDAKRDAARHHNLVQWVLDQVSLVETEAHSSTTNRLKSSEKRGTKRSFTTDDEGQRLKRAKFACKRRLAKARTVSEGTETTETQPSLGMVTNQDAARDAQLDNQIASNLQQEEHLYAVSQGLRRSARIAARRDASRKALGPDISHHVSHSKTVVTGARAARQTSPVRATEGHLAKGQPRRRSQDGGAKLGRRSQRRRQRGAVDE